MTKADVVSNISQSLGVDKADVLAVVEHFMEEVKSSLEKGGKRLFERIWEFYYKNTCGKNRSQYF